MSFNEIIAEKQEWIDLQNKIKDMPSDYQYVYKQMRLYILKSASLNHRQRIELFSDLIVLFEQGIAAEKHVLEVTGEDVAELCDQLIVDNDQLDDRVRNIVDKSMNDILKASGHQFEKLEETYGQGTLHRIYPSPVNDKAWALGMCVAGFAASPLGLTASAVRPNYYLYKQEKILKVVGEDITEHLVHNINGDNYLADNNWYCTKLDVKTRK